MFTLLNDALPDHSKDLLACAGGVCAMSVGVCFGGDSLTEHMELVSYSMGAGVHSVGVGDLNGDGHLDIVASVDRSDEPLVGERGGSFQSRFLYALINQGDGSFVRVEDPIRSFAGNGQFNPSIGDLDGDGLNDIIVSNIYNDSAQFVEISFYWNNGDGTFTFDPEYVDTGTVFGNFNVIDFDLDSVHDFMYVSGEHGSDASSHASVRYNSVGREIMFGFGVSHDTIPVGFQPHRHSSVADFDLDGYPDTYTMSSYPENGFFSVYMNEGNGTRSMLASSVVMDQFRSFSDIDANDFNGDGYPDIAITNDQHDFLDVTEFHLFMNNGDGSFGEPQLYDFGIVSLMSYDFDHDGYSDIVGGSSRNSTAGLVWRNEGDGNFSATGESFPMTRTRYDLNNDGVLDLVSVGEGSVEVYLNTAQSSTCPADFNGDGVINFFDVSAFIHAFNDQDLDADLNGDGTLNFFDVSVFVSLMNKGCP